MEAVVLKRQGQSYTEIATHFQVARITIIKLVKKHRESGYVKDAPKTGRKRATTVRDDRRLVRASLQNRRLTSTDLRQVLVDSGVMITTRTVRNRLREAGLAGCIAAKKPLLSSANKKARLAFARRHQHWTVTDWGRVLWSDECSVELCSSKTRIYVRRRSGERYKEQCLAPTVKFGGGKLMVWGCFSAGGVGELRRVEGSMTQHSYKVILEDAMTTSADKLFDMGNYYFQQDNAPCHKAKSVMDFLAQKKFQVLDWPPQSPDFNPIENLWGLLKRKVAKARPTNINQLWVKIQAAWQQILPEEITRLIQSMPHRMKTAISAKGGSTRY